MTQEWTWKQKIGWMLTVYRERLERASSTTPIDFIKGVQLEAQIAVLEHLYIYALEEEKNKEMNG